MLTFLPLLALVATTTAHTAAWAPGMYCRGGADPTKDDQNTNLAVNPLYQLSKADWWFQHDRGCDKVPPPADEFLELPAGGSFTVEHAHNRAFTTLSYGGTLVTDWPDGKQHPADWNGLAADPGEGCIQDDGALHVQNETSATGTAFAISYESDITKVTMENLAVFTVAEHTPWKRLATFQVPDLPACPPGGCHCAWLWVPKGCGQPNMYMQGFKCNVTGATSTSTIAPAQPPTYCPDDASKCVKGAKQMIAWNQAEGNNVFPPNGVTPSYHAAWGFFPGAQKDIFVAGAAKPSSSVISSSTSSATSSKSSAVATSSSVPISPIVKAASTTSSSLFSKSSSSSSYSSILYSNATSSAPVKALSTTTGSGLPSVSLPVKPVQTSSSSSSSYSYSSLTISTAAKPTSTFSASFSKPTPTTLSTKVVPVTTSSSSSSLSISSGAPAAPTKISGADLASLKAYIDGAWGQWMRDHGY